MTLATQLYTDAEDRQAAIEIVQALRAAGRKNRPDLSSHNAANTASNQSSLNNTNFSSGIAAEKTAHNIAMRLKDNDKKFSGDLGENWMEFVDEYTQIARDYSLNPPQKLQYLHNLFRGDAKRFFLDRIASYATTFQQAVEMVTSEYNSPVRQTRVKNYLNTLRVSSFVSKGLAVPEALSQVYKVITKYSRQAPRSHQGEAHKVEFLHNAVIGYEWSHEPLSRVATHDLSFQQLYGELEAALQLYNEARLAIIRDRASSQESGSIRNNPSNVFYSGQGRYIRNPSEIRTIPNNSKGKSEKRFDPLSVQGCFNCDAPGHLFRDCPKPRNSARAAARKIEYYSKKDSTKSAAVYHVLSDLCSQLDLSPGENSTEIPIELQGTSLFQETMTLHAGESDVLEDKADDGVEEIYVITEDRKTMPTEKFEGACIDSAAQRTVIGLEQAKLYCEQYGGVLDVSKSEGSASFRFGVHRHRSLGSVEIRIPIFGAHFIQLRVDVVNINIPFLLGLDIMTRYGMILDAEHLTLSSGPDGWTLPLRRKHGHLYLEWEARILFTESELRRVHRHFYHPKPERLYAVIKRSDPSKASASLMEDLKKIESTCDTCQRESAPPHRFRVSLPSGEIIFNRELCLDVMSIRGCDVLHIVDRDTKFSAAVSLTDRSAAATWKSFVNAWAVVYIGFPDIISADEGPEFRSSEWKNLLQTAGIQFKLSGVESHNAINSGERYHSYLRSIFERVRNEHNELDNDDILSIAVKACNDTAGPNGLVPTLLVFGVMPRFPLNPIDLPDQVERMRAMESARMEMAQVISKTRLDTALRSNVPTAADQAPNIMIGSEVLVFRERQRKWIGPFRVLDVQGKMIHIDIKRGQPRYSIDKVKPYLRESQTLSDNTPSGGEDTPNVDECEPTHTIPQMHPLDEPGTIEQWNAIFDKPASNSSEIPETNLGDMNSLADITAQVPPLLDINLVEVITSDDPRCMSKEFADAKKKEINGLQKRGTWTIKRKSDLPQGANIVGGRFVLVYKNVGTPEQMAKARYVAQGFADKEKDRMVHNLNTLRQSSTRLVVSVAANKSYRLFSLDVTQAYLQSDEDLTRALYLQPKPRDVKFFGIDDNQILLLNRPIYGITDAGDYWSVTIDRHSREDLNLSPTKGDPSLYVKHNMKDIDGLLAVYADDELICGNEKMHSLISETLKRFETKPLVYDEFDFFGTHIKKLSGSQFSIDQSLYISRLKILPIDCEFKLFRSARASLAWIGLTRPDLCYTINRCAQITPEIFTEKTIKEYNSAVKMLQKTSKVKLVYPRLDQDTLHLRVFADASFANNFDYSSQLGFIICLCDDENHFHILDFGSKKCKRVVRSILGGEVYAFAEAFDRAIMIRYDLEAIYKTEIPLQMFTDSLQMFNVITKGSATTERRLMIDIFAAREAYNRKEITNVGFISGDDNYADGLTKQKPNDKLFQALSSGLLPTAVRQWIRRSD